jgi:hypothetical protein
MPHCSCCHCTSQGLRGWPLALTKSIAGSFPCLHALHLEHCVLPSGPLRELLQAVPTLARIRLHNTTLTSSPGSSRGTPRQQAPLVQGVSEPDHHLIATQAQPKRQLGDSVLDLLSGGLRALELSCHPHPLPLCSGETQYCRWPEGLSQPELLFVLLLLARVCLPESCADGLVLACAG